MDDLEQRIRSLEEWKHAQDTALAVDEVRRAHMDARFDRVDNELSNMKGAFNKVLWAVGLLVVSAGVRFVLDGGLTIVP